MTQQNSNSNDITRKLNTCVSEHLKKCKKEELLNIVNKLKERNAQFQNTSINKKSTRGDLIGTICKFLLFEAKEQFTGQNTKTPLNSIGQTEMNELKKHLESKRCRPSPHK